MFLLRLAFRPLRSYPTQIIYSVPSCPNKVVNLHFSHGIDGFKSCHIILAIIGNRLLFNGCFGIFFRGYILPTYTNQILILAEIY